MRIPSRAACTIGLLLLTTSALRASDTTFVSQGARVKLFPTQPGAKAITGNVTDVASDTLIILREGDQEPLTFAPRDLRKIEVSQGKRSNWLLGGAAGFVVFGAAGAAIAAENYSPDPGLSQSGVIIGAGLISGVAGFGIGAGVGALIKTERWKVAQFPAPPPVALNVGKDGSVRLAFSIRL